MVNNEYSIDGRRNGHNVRVTKIRHGFILIDLTRLAVEISFLYWCSSESVADPVIQGWIKINHVFIKVACTYFVLTAY